MWIVLLAMCLLAGCGAVESMLPEPDFPIATEVPPEAIVIETPAPTATPTPAPTPTPTPLPTPTPVPVVRSMTSGVRQEDQSVPALYEPIIISVENSTGARPQVSLNYADIIYEFAVESSITRFQVLFNDVKPVFAGPLRSSRVYLMRFQQEWQGIYAHEGYGGSFYNEKWINMHATRGYSYLKKFFWRTSEAKKSEHTMMIGVNDVASTIYGAIPDEKFPTPSYTRFWWDEGVSYPDGEPFEKVTLNLFYRGVKESEKISFTYDEETNTLVRYQDGYKFKTRMPTDRAKDRKSGFYTRMEDLVVQNLIVQYVPYWEIPGDRKGRRNCDLLGEGPCDFFINGIHMTGTWSRPSYEETTSYRLEDGSTLVMEPGRTWVCMHPDNMEENPVHITLKNGTTYTPNVVAKGTVGTEKASDYGGDKVQRRTGGGEDDVD